MALIICNNEQKVSSAGALFYHLLPTTAPMKSQRIGYTRCTLFILSIPILLILSNADGYTSIRKKKSNKAAPSEPLRNNNNNIISPHYNAQQEEPSEVEHRRLSEKPNIDDTANVDTAAAAGGAKTNALSPAIQQISKGAIVKDDLNRGPPLASELYHFCRNMISH